MLVLNIHPGHPTPPGTNHYKCGSVTQPGRQLTTKKEQRGQKVTVPGPVTNQKDDVPR